MARPENPALRQSISSLLALLVEAAEGTRHEALTREVLESQARTVGLTLPERGVVPMSLNTAKHVANTELAGGFDQLNVARKAALDALGATGDEERSGREESLLKRCRDAERRAASLDEDLAHMSGAFRFALDCARRYAKESRNPSVLETFINDEREMLARASLVRRRPHLVVSTRSGEDGPAT